MEIRSPDGSRPPTPVHSDTEYEVKHLVCTGHALGGQSKWPFFILQQVGLMRPKASDDPSLCPQQSWRWGELPSPPVLNRTSPPKPMSGSVNRDASPCDRSADTGAVPRVNSEASTKTENNGRQAQTTAEGVIIAFACFSIMRAIMH